MTREHDRRKSYRCVIAPEDGAAKLKLNGKLVDCRVLDTSCDAFSIQIPAKHSHQLLARNPRLELSFRGERWEVNVNGHFRDQVDEVTVALERVRELTKLKAANSWGGASGGQFSAATDPSFLLALMVAFLLCCVCLPGIGDSLGTATRVREGMGVMMKYVSEAIQ